MFLDVALVPEQSVGGLVAHLHPSGLHAVLLEEGEHVNGVVAQVAFHLLVAVSAPRLRDGLLGGVGPRVAVVEVDHHVHAEGFCSERHLEDFLFSARSAPRIDPHAEPDGTHLIVVLEEFEALALAALAVVELHSAGFLSGKESHVGTLDEVGLVLRHQRDGTQEEKQG